jgi:hypothetical protein
VGIPIYILKCVGQRAFYLFDKVPIVPFFAVFDHHHQGTAYTFITKEESNYSGDIVRVRDFPRVIYWL